MPPRQQCEFFLLRYVPDPLKSEFVNIGVVLRTAGSDSIRFADVQFTTDWRRVRCLDPEADLDVFTELEQEIRAALQGGANGEWLLNRMPDTFSNAIQLSPVKPVLAESPQQELGVLAEMYLQRHTRASRVVSGRQQILRVMRDEFSKQGVWDFLAHDVKMAKYTHPGDPLKIDCSYRPNGIIRMFQAVSLEADVNAAKVLAFSFPELRAGIARVEMADTALTAVVEADLHLQDEKIAFALHTLRKQDIQISTIADMPQIAERARVELRL